MTNYVPYNLSHEIGVLSYPLSKQVVQLWRFKTPADSRKSADALYKLGMDYLDAAVGSDRTVMVHFLRADLVRKFIQMGWTRSKRYYNHASGRKYASDGTVLPPDNSDPDKLISSEIFKTCLKKFTQHERYVTLKDRWQSLTKTEKIILTKAALY